MVVPAGRPPPPPPPPPEVPVESEVAPPGVEPPDDDEEAPAAGPVDEEEEPLSPPAAAPPVEDAVPGSNPVEDEDDEDEPTIATHSNDSMHERVSDESVDSNSDDGAELVSEVKTTHDRRSVLGIRLPTLRCTLLVCMRASCVALLWWVADFVQLRSAAAVVAVRALLRCVPTDCRSVVP
jgi:hypothetical protein